MSATFEVICPYCRGELAELARGITSDALRTGVLACVDCGSQVQLVLRLQKVTATAAGLRVQREREGAVVHLRDRQAPFAGLIDLILATEAELLAERAEEARTA